MIEKFDTDLFKRCMPYFDKPPVIFDVGAHEGHYTKFVLEIIPDADCYLFEPNANINLPSYFKTYQYAVCDTNEDKIFYIPLEKKNDELSSLYKRAVFKDLGWIEEEIVQCITIDHFSQLMKIPEIDFIKVDVEGAELDVINGCPSMMRDKKIKFIQVEYGGTYPDAGIKFTQVINTANLFGYKVYELIDNRFNEVTIENFIEDYRYSVFVLTYLPCS